MADNLYRREYEIDRFARHYYCQHARLNQLRADKDASRRKVRGELKKSCRKALEEDFEEEIK